MHVLQDFTYQASYVAQENLFLEIFSVRESLEFAAHLTMPSSSTQREKEAKIDEVVKIMGLQSCENTMVGGGFYRGLSGGQMKRLSIAVTLLSGSSILFLDEPTSKLDSAAAFNVVKTVQQLADQGKINRRKFMIRFPLWACFRGKQLRCHIHEPFAVDS